MTTAPTLPDIPPYHLRHLVSNVKDLLGVPSGENRPSSRAGRTSVEVRCAQALGTEIYVGCSDGSLLRYAFVDTLDASPESYQLLTHQAIPSGQAIEQIVLAPGIEKALVLCDHQIYFFTLPNLELVEQIKPVRHAMTFALDDAQQRKPLPDRRSHQSETANLCVVKRGSITVYTLGSRLQFRKEIQLPNGATLARLSNKHLCVADQETYNVIDLETTSLIQLLPLSQVDDASPVKPSITVIGESEFLLLSRTESSTLGVFITGTGDPVRGTLTWGMHPAVVCCDYPYVTSLLPNGTIEVHSLETQSICQVIQPSKGFCPISLEKASNGYVVPRGDQERNINIVDFRLVEPDAPNTSEVEESAKHSTHSGNAAAPSGGDVFAASSTKKRPARPPKACVLAVGPDGVYALATPTLMEQTDTLLESHKLKEAAELAKERQRKIEQRKRDSLSHNAMDIEAQMEEIQYVYQRLGYKYLSETMFEDAGNNLFRGNVDPRLLIRLFPALRGTLLLSSSLSFPVFYGLESQMRALGSVDTIIKNYSPHLQPNTRSAPPTSELRKLLMVAARNMLRDYLRKWNNKVLYSGEPAVKEISQVIDTVLVKLLAESEDTQELYSLLDSSEHVVVEEVEETLVRTGQYNALFKLYQKRNDEGKLLEIWSKLVEGVWTDEDIQDPLGHMIALLGQTSNRALVQQWGLWLVKRDMAAGLKLLMSGEGKRSAIADDSALLSRIEAANLEAGHQFLEYLVLQKHSNDPNLHMRLAGAYVDQLIYSLYFPDVLQFFRDSAFEYSIQHRSMPLLTYLVTNVEPSSPMYGSLRTRCRAALFLQGSPLYDVSAVREKISAWPEVLGLELAILDGKLGKHMDALKMLVHTLRDTASADAYCALGGGAISPKVAQFVGERLGLQAYAAFVVGSLNRRGGHGRGHVKNKSSVEETRGRLLRVLLEVYMSGGEATEGHTARLLNSQGGKLDVLDVLTLVPPAWSLNVVSSFLTRSLRQSVHERCESEILKAVCLGQNLEVRDTAYSLLREQGAFIQEPIPGLQPEPEPGSRSPSPSSSVGASSSNDGALQEKEKAIVLVEEAGVDGRVTGESEDGVGVINGVVSRVQQDAEKQDSPSPSPSPPRPPREAETRPVDGQTT